MSYQLIKVRVYFQLTYNWFLRLFDKIFLLLPIGVTLSKFWNDRKYLCSVGRQDGEFFQLLHVCNI